MFITLLRGFGLSCYSADRSSCNIRVLCSNPGAVRNRVFVIHWRISRMLGLATYLRWGEGVSIELQVPVVSHFFLLKGASNDHKNQQRVASGTRLIPTS